MYDAVRFSKLTNLAQLLKVGFSDVLHCMVDRCDKLLGVVYLGSSHGHEFERARPGVVVC